MTKRELIDEILSINTSAEPAFLAEFDDGDLRDYLRKLRRVFAPAPKSRWRRSTAGTDGMTDPSRSAEPGRSVVPTRCEGSYVPVEPARADAADERGDIPEPGHQPAPTTEEQPPTAGPLPLFESIC